MSKVKKTVKDYENGLKHIHYEAPFLNQITMSFMFDVGSSNEDNEELYGISHFLEHMIFNGSKKYPDENSITEVYNKAGYYQNAGTWVSFTEYYISGRTAKAEEAFPVLFDMVFNPLLREKDIDKEKGIVLEELRMYKNQPYSMLDEKVDNLLYGGTTYAHPILGTEKSIKKFSKKLIKSYHNRYYSPNNGIFVTYGGTQFAQIDQMVKPLLKSVNPQKIPEYQIGGGKAPMKNNQVVLEMDVDTPIYLISIKREKLSTLNQLLAYMFFMTLLGAGDGSLLNKNLVFKQNLISSYSFGIAPMRDFSGIYFSASVNRQNLERLKESYKEILMKYSDKNIFTDLEFKRTKGYILGRVARVWDDIFAPTDITLFSLPFLNTSLGLDIDINRFQKQIQDISKEEVNSLWKKYLSDLLIDTKEEFKYVEGTVFPISDTKE